MERLKPVTSHCRDKLATDQRRLVESRSCSRTMRSSSSPPPTCSSSWRASNRSAQERGEGTGLNLGEDMVLLSHSGELKPVHDIV